MREMRSEANVSCKVCAFQEMFPRGGGKKYVHVKGEGEIWEWEKEKRIPLKLEFKNNIKAKNLVFIAENDGISERNSSG